MLAEFLSERPPWWVAGPGLGLVVVGLLALINGRLGVVGAYGEALERIARRRPDVGWRVWFLAGIVVGGFLFAAAGGGWRAGDGYGWLSRAFTGEGEVAIAGILLGSGALIGYGAKTAGGCTSGNGLCGCGLASPASFVATGVFMATAVATAFLTRWVVGVS